MVLLRLFGTHGPCLARMRLVKSNRILLWNRKFFQESNRIECKSNRMNFSIFDTIRFDLIWTKTWSRKLWIVAVKNEKFKWWNVKWHWLIFLPSLLIIPLKMDQFIDGQFFLLYMTAKPDLYWIESFFESNRIVLWIESISNRNRIDIESKSTRNRIESKGFCNFSIENRIESKPTRFDSPGGYKIVLT